MSRYLFLVLDLLKRIWIDKKCLDIVCMKLAEGRTQIQVSCSFKVSPLNLKILGLHAEQSERVQLHQLHPPAVKLSSPTRRSSWEGLGTSLAGGAVAILTACFASQNMACS